MSIRNARSRVRRAKRVALIIESNVAPRRGMLAGVARYMQEHGPWDIYLKPYGVDKSLGEWMRNWDGDGIIAAVSPTDSFPRLHAPDAFGVATAATRMTPAMRTSETQQAYQARLPIVDLVGGLPGAPLVHTNDRSVGRLGAEHLFERGYRNFAFVGHQLPWAIARQRGFAERICEAAWSSEKIHTFAIATTIAAGPSGWEQQQTELVAWSQSLPKPIGVMTSTDLVGQQFLEACSRAGVAVPEQVAVIGADNDELICAVANPPLSSVIINDPQRGYAAAALLDKLMQGKPPPREPVWVEPAGVVGRASTEILAIADQDVALALQFIRKHASDRIRVTDVVERVPLSRSMLERRFRKAAGRTINEEIVRVRLNRAIELLCATPLELKLIARRAGFRSASYMGVVFRTKVGRTPSSYRDSSRRAGGAESDLRH